MLFSCITFIELYGAHLCYSEYLVCCVLYSYYANLVCYIVITVSWVMLRTLSCGQPRRLSYLLTRYVGKMQRLCDLYMDSADFCVFSIFVK